MHPFVSSKARRVEFAAAKRPRRPLLRELVLSEDLSGIEPRGVAGRQPASGGRGAEHGERDEAERRRIVWRNTEQRARDEAQHAHRDRDADGRSDHDGLHSATHHEHEHLARSASEHESHADVLAVLVNEPAHDAIDADHGEDQGDDGERDDDRGDVARRGESGIDEVGASGDVADGSGGV